MAAVLPGVKSYQVIQQWRENGVPVEHCAAIELATDGQVTRQELRPTDWQRIWPELTNASLQEPANCAEPIYPGPDRRVGMEPGQLMPRQRRSNGAVADPKKAA